MRARKLVIWALLFVPGIAVTLYLQFLFNHAGKLALIPHGFAVAYGYFLGWMLLELFKNPARNQITRYTRRETHYDGSNRREVEITLHSDG